MKALAIYHAYSRSAFAVLAFICAASVFLYGVFLLEAVGHTAARARAGHAVAELKTQLSSVESRYLTETEAITPARAQALGFVPPASVATVYAAEAAQVLTLQTMPVPAAQ